MGFIKSRYVSEVTFVDSLSTDDDLRDLTLRIETEGAGKYLKLSNGLQGGDIWFYHPDDLKRLYETAVQLWAQGDAISDSTVIERPQFYDVAGAAIQPLQAGAGAEIPPLRPNTEAERAFLLSALGRIQETTKDSHPVAYGIAESAIARVSGGGGSEV